MAASYLSCLEPRQRRARVAGDPARGCVTPWEAPGCVLGLLSDFSSAVKQSSLLRARQRHGSPLSSEASHCTSFSVPRLCPPAVVLCCECRLRFSSSSPFPLPPDPNVVRGHNVINVIIPEGRIHFFQQLGYVLATLLLFIVLLIIVVLITRKRRQRGRCWRSPCSAYGTVPWQGS